jgi:hypothetical protein
MQGLMKMMPDGHYDLKCWGADPERQRHPLRDLHRDAHRLRRPTADRLALICYASHPSDAIRRYTDASCRRNRRCRLTMP